MTKLTKIHSDDCDICVSIGSQAKALAEENKFEYEEISLDFLASNESPLREYVINYHVTPNNGRIDLPIYLITSNNGDIQASGVVKDIDEVANLIFSWNKWASSQKP